MINRFKPISISLSPNVEKDDVKLVLSLIVRPWLWTTKKLYRHSRLVWFRSKPFEKKFAVKKLEQEFKNYLGVKYAVSFNSGRSAFYAILKSLTELSELAPYKHNLEVAMQAFSCNAAINPVLWAGLNPIYIDCNEDDFNIDVSDLKKKINEKVRIIVVQHTFGNPADMDKILKICQENDLILIEDCAHALGAEWRPVESFPHKRDFGKARKVGTFGKAAFFSFSRDKVISSIYGGIAVTNDEKIADNLKKLQKEFGQPSYFWIFQQLLHPILLHFIILPIYNFLDLGKIFLILSQYLNILSKAVHWKEKRGKKPDYFPKAMPNALALLALNQFKKIDKFYDHRKKIFEYYFKSLKNTDFILPAIKQELKQTYLRFTVKHSNAHKIIFNSWKKQNILIGDWYTSPIAPFDTNLEKMRYKRGSCPKAERLSKITLNLPTHINISQKQAEIVIKFLKNQPVD